MDSLQMTKVFFVGNCPQAAYISGETRNEHNDQLFGVRLKRGPEISALGFRDRRDQEELEEILEGTRVWRHMCLPSGPWHAFTELK